MPRLPPLPPRAQWKTIWPRSVLRYSMDRTNREFNGRFLLANSRLTDEFTKALRIRDDEVIIEAFSGPGILTRSLLNGGVSDTEDAGEARIDRGREYKKPALVVACEPSPKLLEGLGMPTDQSPEEIPARFESEDYSVYQSKVHQSEHEPRLLLSPSTPYRWPTLTQMLGHKLVQPFLQQYSSGAEGAAGSPSETTVVGSSETGTPDTQTSGAIASSTQRPWTAPPPPITIVSQMPLSIAGDQMVSQWVGSAVGNSTGERSWIWKWGRLRLALLVSKTQYDRMMAGPGETIHCKLSIMTRALFHITPLPPYHHVFNIDKSFKRTTSTPLKSKSKTGTKSPSKASGLAPPPDPFPPHTTYPDDFYPVPNGYSKVLDIPLKRPEMLGVMLVPRVESAVTLDNKEEWDYVLRKCFVTEAQGLEASLRNLAFGAEGLVGKIEDGLESEPAEPLEPSGERSEAEPIGSAGEAGESEPIGFGSASSEPIGKVSERNEGPPLTPSPKKSKWKGKAVSRHKTVRDLDVDEWTRVVDVFTRWPFKPENLMLDNRPGEDVRQIGQD